ncbi:MAG TPA: penicillin-binding protein 2 [Candidatus Methylomirabilis sp.]|nr:penicillin-binding protein 2 [Candidatus Methylomirabilis sp.]
MLPLGITALQRFDHSSRAFTNKLPASKRGAWGRRVLALALMTMVGFAALVGQLWYLQALEGSRLQELSDKNRIRIRPVAAPRGILFDRNGLPLVDNRPAFTLSLIPREMEDRDTVLARLSVLLKIPFAELRSSLDRVPSDSFQPVRVRRGLSLAEVTQVEERKLELPGVIVEVESQRVYPTSTFAAHLLGYVREVSEEQMKPGRYRRGDMIGQSGLERVFDEYLRGRDGATRIEVDALGRPVRSMKGEEPDPGGQVITSVDRRIQEAAERAMGGHAGAVVVMDPRNGDVLAMTSSPSFALDRLTGNLNREDWQRLVSDPRTPLMNRALQSQYAPGSVFKVVVAAAGLQERTLTPMDHTYCNGEFHLGAWTFKDWKEGGHGHVDLRSAIVHSCNIFFYQAGLKVGAEAITRYARAFGLGMPPGTELGNEKAGLIPSVGWRRGRGGHVWQAGDTVNISIGQGRVLVTPMQVARMMGAVANGGILWQPRLVQRVVASDGTLVYSASSKATGHVDLSPVVWAFLRSALVGVVNDGGTGNAARLPGVLIAGKTGTAQSVANSDSARGQDHAWFASFAPADDPQVVVVVLVERGGKGGQVAAPIARKIYESIFLEKVAMVGFGGDS